MAKSSYSQNSPGDLKLLAIGDVHLGTRPGSLPDDLEGVGVNPRALTPEAALSAAVDRAINESVDAVLFAGDVVESANARFEALRPLEIAVERLREQGIPVLAVVGNHDVDALPRLAGMIEGLELLGEGGRWQARVVEKPGGPSVEIVGWSFPERRVRDSPIAGLLRDPLIPARPGIARLGLLHADLDASGGNYAPITRSEMRSAGFDAWLLGHIHKPSLSTARSPDGQGPHGYLGSLVGLDPGEMGPHGPWLVRVTSAGEVTTQQLPIAPLRWDSFNLQVEEDEGADDIADRLMAEMDRVTNEIHTTGSIPMLLGLRPHLVGRTRHYEVLRRTIADGGWRGMRRSVGSTLVFLDRVVDDLALAHDLEELARGNDPPAILARKLLVLARPGEARDSLVDSTRRALWDKAHETRWSALQAERDAPDPLADDALVDLLTRSGTAALSDLLAQRDANKASNTTGITTGTTTANTAANTTVNAETNTHTRSQAGGEA